MQQQRNEKLVGHLGATLSDSASCAFPKVITECEDKMGNAVPVALPIALHMRFLIQSPDGSNVLRAMSCALVSTILFLCILAASYYCFQPRIHLCVSSIRGKEFLLGKTCEPTALIAMLGCQQAKRCNI